MFPRPKIKIQLHVIILELKIVPIRLKYVECYLLEHSLYYTRSYL